MYICNSIKSVCTVIKAQSHKLYFLTVFTGSDAIRFIKETIYLGFTFRDVKCDDCDVWTKEIVVCQVQHIITIFSQCSADVERLFCFKFIAEHCTA